MEKYTCPECRSIKEFMPSTTKSNIVQCANCGYLIAKFPPIPSPDQNPFSSDSTYKLKAVSDILMVLIIGMVFTIFLMVIFK